MSVPLWHRFVAACILGLGVCLASSAQDKPEKKYPSASEVADLLKKEPISLETWMVWRGRLLDWISDRGKGTDPAFEAARKFARSQANDKEEMNAPVAKDYLAWYLLGGAYLDEVESKPTPEQLAGDKRAEKALRESIKLDDKFAYSHRKLAQALIAEEDIEPGEEKDLTKMTPRLAEAAKELNEAARLDPKIDLGGVRHRLGKLLYQQDRFAPADATLLQAIKEESEPNTALFADASLAIMRNPKRNYNDTLAALKDLQERYPTEAVIPFVRGLTLVEEAGLEKTQEAFQRSLNLAQEGFQSGWALKQGDPAKLIPNREVYAIADKIIKNDKASWPMASNQLAVLAINWPDDPNIAAAHALVRYKADDYDLAASEIARIRKLGAKPDQVFEHFLRINSRVVPEIEFQAVQNRLMVAFMWMMGIIIALYALGLVAMVGASPRTAPRAKDAEPATGKASSASPLKFIGMLVLGAILWLAFRAFGVSFRGSLVLTGTVLGAGAALIQRKQPAPVWPELAPALTSGYMLIILIGVGLFYASLLFIFVGLAVSIGGVLFLLLSAPALSFTLLIILFGVGVLAWLFGAMVIAQPAKETRGIAVNASEIARLRQAVDEATRKADTDPIKEIRLTTGSAVTLTMIGRGPLGLLGGSKPTLVIGYSALRLLNVAELQSLVVQQLAPLSKRENSWSRIVYSCWLSMADALEQMHHSNNDMGGINPFYYLLAAYFGIFNRLAGPFIRGRIADADQAAAKLNGGAVLESAMLKSQADGPLYQARLEELVKELLAEDPDNLGNMYAAWDELCADPITPSQQGTDVQPAGVLRDLNFALLAVGPRERNQARRWALAFKGPTPHGLPTLAQRISTLPSRSRADKGKKDSSSDITTADAIRRDDSKPPATELLDNVEGIEEQLTEFSIPAAPAASQEKPAEAPATVK